MTATRLDAQYSTRSGAFGKAYRRWQMITVSVKKQVSKLADMSILAFTRTCGPQLPLGRKLHFVNAWYIDIYNKCVLN